MGKLSQKTCDFHFINSCCKAAAWLNTTALGTCISCPLNSQYKVLGKKKDKFANVENFRN